MFRLSRGEHANQVPHPRANLAFTLFTLGAVVNNAAVEGFSSSMESVRNVSTIALIGFAAISFLKMRHNVEAIPQAAAALPEIEHESMPPIREGAAAVPLEDLRWISQTGQRPIPEEAAAIRAHSAAILNEHLSEQ